MSDHAHTINHRSQRSHQTENSKQTVETGRTEHASVDLDPAFVRRILSPYLPTQTDYLKSASVARVGSLAGACEPVLAARGHFLIASSCYIKSTGHFNAVEFLICYNQLAYTTCAYIIANATATVLRDERLSEACHSALRGLTIEKFFDQQLSSMFIVKAETRFKRPIEPGNFTGELAIQSMSYRSGTLFLDTTCRFYDESDGDARGKILLAYRPQNG